MVSKNDLYWNIETNVVMIVPLIGWYTVKWTKSNQNKPKIKNGCKARIFLCQTYQNLLNFSRRNTHVSIMTQSSNNITNTDIHIYRDMCERSVWFHWITILLYKFESSTLKRNLGIHLSSPLTPASKINHLWEQVTNDIGHLHQDKKKLYL